MKSKYWHKDTIVVFDRQMTATLLGLLDVCRNKIPGTSAVDDIANWIYEQLPEEEEARIIGTGTANDPWRKA